MRHLLDVFYNELVSVFKTIFFVLEITCRVPKLPSYVYSNPNETVFAGNEVTYRCRHGLVFETLRDSFDVLCQFDGTFFTNNIPACIGK